MARRRRATKRAVTVDSRYESPVVGRLISRVMERGKKSVAERIVYGAIDQIKELIPEGEPLDIFNAALNNIKPRLEVKSRRVGGATYQVPLEVPPERQEALAMRWVIQYAQSRKGVGMGRAMALELADAYRNQGNAIKKREDTHKMAQANKAFAHYRW